MDESLLSDARDLLSLDADVSSSVYASAYQSIPSGGHEKTVGGREKTPRSLTGEPFSDLSGIQEEYSHVTTPLSGGRVGGSVWGVEGKLSVRVKLNVNSLTVTFNKLEHPLARGGVAGVTAEVKLRRGNIDISGSLGQGSVMDMTETGAYYRERYIHMFGWMDTHLLQICGSVWFVRAIGNKPNLWYAQTICFQRNVRTQQKFAVQVKLKFPVRNGRHFRALSPSPSVIMSNCSSGGSC